MLVHTVEVGGRRRLAAQAAAARAPLLLNDPRALVALASLPGGFDRGGAETAWAGAGLTAEEAAELWDALDTAGLLVEDDGEPSWWEEYEWTEARAYHHATRDYPFLQMDEPGAFADDAQRMRDYRDEEAPPSPYQRLGGEALVDLPRRVGEESHDDWFERLTPAQRVGAEGVALLLDVCFGERGRITIADGSPCLLKSIPSGGARHPTELFLASFELEGIEPGLYHYAVEGGRLELLRAGQLREPFERATLDLFSKQANPPAAVLVFTSRVGRAMWRYRDPRSFRAIMVDVGHAVAAYRHVARRLGFRTFAYQKMRDSEVAGLLGLDPVIQPPLYVATLVR